MRVLITGGAGFIGSHIADAMLARGDRVAVLDNLATGSRENVRDEVTFFETDIRDRSAVLAAFQTEPPEVVFHLAAQADVRRSMDDPAFDYAVNVGGTLNLLEAARRHGTGRFIFASTGGAVYGEPAKIPVSEAILPRPLSCYGASKRAAEDYLAIYADTAGIRTTVLRYANVYGPRQNPKGEAGVVAIFSLALLEGRTPQIFGDGAKTRDYVFVQDVVRANLLAVEKQVDGTFNIGTGRQVSDQQVFDTIQAAVGSSVKPQYGPRRKGEVEHIALDASLAGSALGWRPEVTFEQGVAQAVAYYKAEKK